MDDLSQSWLVVNFPSVENFVLAWQIVSTPVMLLFVLYFAQHSLLPPRNTLGYATLICSFFIFLIVQTFLGIFVHPFHFYPYLIIIATLFLFNYAHPYRKLKVAVEKCYALLPDRIEAPRASHPLLQDLVDRFRVEIPRIPDPPDPVFSFLPPSHEKEIQQYTGLQHDIRVAAARQRELVPAIQELCAWLEKYLPDPEPSVFRAPLYTFYPPAPNYLLRMFVKLGYPDHVSDLPEAKQPKSLHDLLSLYSKTPLYDFFMQTVPFTIPQSIRFEHHWIVSPPGGGKTQTYQAMILSDLELVKEGKASIVVIDSQGDLIKNITSLKVFSQELAGKLTVIDPRYPISINPFALQGEEAVDLLLYVFSGLLETEMTPKQETLFRYVIRACMAVPEATISTFGAMLHDITPFKTAIASLSPPARDFFRTQYDSQFKKTREEVGWRLSFMLDSPVLSRTFSSSENDFDFYRELSEARVIVINTDKDRLKDRSSLFGRIFIAMLLHAAERRASLRREERLPVFCYIDEFGDYSNDSRVSKILDQARKMNVGMILANQRLSQVTAPGLLDALQNCAIKFARDCNDSDAAALARNMNTTPQFIRSQPRQYFAASIRGQKTLSLHVPFGMMERQPKMTPEERKALQKSRPEPKPTHLNDEAQELEDPDYGEHTKPAIE